MKQSTVENSYALIYKINKGIEHRQMPDVVELYNLLLTVGIEVENSYACSLHCWSRRYIMNDETYECLWENGDIDNTPIEICKLIQMRVPKNSS